MGAKISIGHSKSQQNKVISESKEILKKVALKLRTANIKFTISMEYVKEGENNGFEIKN